MASSEIVDELTSLVSLISDAVKVVKSHYAHAQKPISSLDSVEPGPFDSSEKVSDQLATAIRTIEAACAQLSSTIAGPAHTITNKAYE